MESIDPTSSPPKQDHHVQKVGTPNKSQDGRSGSSTEEEEDDPQSAKSGSDEVAVAVKAPPNQEMEGYRIPASVFERNKSSTPADWSAASNDSLFSIHMSFANDNDNIPRLSTSEQMFSYSAASGGGAPELGIAEATMLEVIKENDSMSPPPRPAPGPGPMHRPTGSNQSNMSFAFSVDARRMPSSEKSIPAAAQAEDDSESSTPPAPAEKEKEAQTQAKWYFCFLPCCSSCS